MSGGLKFDSRTHHEVHEGHEDAGMVWVRRLYASLAASDEDAHAGLGVAGPEEHVGMVSSRRGFPRP
jgi:hypothetical protein